MAFNFKLAHIKITFIFAVSSGLRMQYSTFLAFTITAGRTLQIKTWWGNWGSIVEVYWPKLCLFCVSFKQNRNSLLILLLLNLSLIMLLFLVHPVSKHIFYTPNKNRTLRHNKYIFNQMKNKRVLQNSIFKHLGSRK